MCCYQHSIAYIDAKLITAIRLAFIGFFTLTLSFLVLYLSRLNLELYPYLALVLSFIIEIFGEKHLLGSTVYSELPPMEVAGPSNSGISGGGNGNSGDGYRPPKDNPNSKAGGGPGVSRANAPMVLYDEHGNILQAPANYTGQGATDRTFGTAIANSLEARAHFHKNPAGLGKVKPHSNSVGSS